jgi:hypothetical protein
MEGVFDVAFMRVPGWEEVRVGSVELGNLARLARVHTNILSIGADKFKGGGPGFRARGWTTRMEMRSRW